MDIIKNKRFYRNNRTVINLALFLLLVLAVWGYEKAQENLVSPSPTLTADATSSSFGSNNTAALGLPTWITVYFTDPKPPDNLGLGIDQTVKKAIDAATKTIEVTSFDLNLPSLVNALVSANKRGVKVRVVYDGTNGNLELDNAASENKPFDAIKTLTTAKVALVDGGRSNGLMHDKWVIVDSNVLFIGSWNLSYNDTFRNNNNLLRITEPKIIENYQAKFTELFVDKRFGTKSQVKIPNPFLTIDGFQVENYMAPKDEVMAKLVKLVQGAKKSVHFMIFTFTHDDLAKAMIARSKSGIKVEGVIENRGASQGVLGDLFCAKVPVKTDGNKYTMHHKVIIIDSETVITGSYNFTKAADDVNDENVLVIHNRGVAALYEQEYQRMFGSGEIPSASEINCSN